jgi:crossover junction endonuclease EME1
MVSLVLDALTAVERTEDIEDWIFNLAADVAIRPYKLLQKAHLSFAPADGVRKGSTPTDTFELMLQEVPGITPSAAKGISQEYPSFRDLQRAFERAERDGTATFLLAECRVSTLRNGTASGRKVGKALASKVYMALRQRDCLAL